MQINYIGNLYFYKEFIVFLLPFKEIVFQQRYMKFITVNSPLANHTKLSSVVLGQKVRNKAISVSEHHQSQEPISLRHGQVGWDMKPSITAIVTRIRKHPFSTPSYLNSHAHKIMQIIKMSANYICILRTICNIIRSLISN